MIAKPKIPREQALKVARTLYDILSPFCERCKVVGSLRRGKRTVSDIELLYIPKMAPDPETFFNALLGDTAASMISMADLTLDRLVKDGVLAKRLSSAGTTAWGELNKLAIHVESKIPVDFFATTQERWWVSLVVRTGGKVNNLRLANSALQKGLHLNAYGAGFTDKRTGEKIPANSEEEVFSIAGVPYARPEFRQ